MPASRPTVKRQYGARKTAGESEKPTTTSPTSILRSSASSSSAYGLSPPRKSLRLLSNAGDDWTAAVAETFSSPMMSGEEESSGSKTRRTREKSTPPTTPVMEEKGGGRILRERKTPTKPPTLKGDLRSFFKRTSPRKRQRLFSPTDGSDSAGSFTSSSSTSSSRTAFTSISSTSSSSSSGKPAKYEQLYLDPFHTAGHATLSCTTCALSYARTPEDIAFHAKHHKKVVSGCDWIASDDANGCTVVEEAVDWGAKHGGKVVMLKDILETVDTELSSTSLTPEQLTESKFFLFVTPQRKVIACAVVQRIKCAHQIVQTEAKDEAGDEKKDLLRFGEDQGAIFCSPTPSPTLLGVQRIWTSTSARRHGLASLLLDHVAAKYIYGSPIPRVRRVEDFAFSQPTGKGQKLATAWTGSGRFKVFVD
ncbi:N-acetyltransferase [Rhodotorula toruloides]|uniref:N-acetyltransferase n=1 Tax=Rhodotorula toruloides TaxID=5286 RepID=A0A511KGA6_RHOTO|nr:N-acetyltransferase [Rhodotorula toruloides]